MNCLVRCLALPLSLIGLTFGQIANKTIDFGTSDVVMSKGSVRAAKAPVRASCDGTIRG